MFRDVDAALDIASRHGIRIMFVLLDFLWCDPATRDTRRADGRPRRVLADADGRDALLDLVLRPLLERYGEEPQILAWDIVNEPEWITAVDAARTSARFSSTASL